MKRFFISSLLAMVILAGLTIEVNGRRHLKECKFKGHRMKIGQKFQFLCNDCICQEDREVKCTPVECNDKERECEFEGKTYKKGEKFVKDCNMCRCTLLGFVSCTNKICIHKDEVHLRFCNYRGKIIPPNTRFKERCRECICHNEGTVDCSDDPCKKEKDGECFYKNMYYSTNESFKFDCKLCKCEEYAHLSCVTLPCCDSNTGELIKPSETSLGITEIWKPEETRNPPVVLKAVIETAPESEVNILVKSP